MYDDDKEDDEEDALLNKKRRRRRRHYYVCVCYNTKTNLKALAFSLLFCVLLLLLLFNKAYMTLRSISVILYFKINKNLFKTYFFTIKKKDGLFDQEKKEKRRMFLHREKRKKKAGFGLGVTVNTMKCVHMRGVMWGLHFSSSYLSRGL